ncbi:MAG TPA: glycosyltransferase family 4 protein, partial [Rhodopila sp.]|nr:glycosyltransferase family 4 protein [Rhodopila sp.]
NHGIFVENRLRHLLSSRQATSTVLAPVPWFPFRAKLFGDWALHAAAPPTETRHAIPIHHPRYPVVPKLGMTIAPWLLYRAMIPPITRLLRQGHRFDLIDAHYLYPDGVAATWLGRRFGLPVVITARGTDVNLIPRYRLPRRLIQTAIHDAAALVAVSTALKQALLALGAPQDKVTVLRNGVETTLFHPPQDRTATRAALGLAGPTLLSVGGLIERKGHHRTIEAMRHLPGFHLLIAGEGPERDRLATLVRHHDLTDRVRLLGPVPHRDLPALYGAADASILASSREGWANVLLESMACGTPVIAANIWGNPEVVRSPEAGLIYDPNTKDGIAAGVRRLFAALPDRAATRAYAEAFSWDETTQGQLALFRQVLAERRGDLRRHEGSP